MHCVAGGASRLGRCASPASRAVRAVANVHCCFSRSAGYRHYGLNRGEHEGKTGIWYREWAPGAKVRPCR